MQSGYPGKRLFDLILSTVALVILSPALLVMMILVKLDSPGPVFFKQKRSGREGKTFDILKLRSMQVHEVRPDEQTYLNDPKVTRVGRFIRRLKIDELPQIWHVVTGEMSIVGPRPAAAHLAAAYTPRQRRRLAVRPGLTGWAQVNGNVQLTWDERIELDLWYIDHMSFLLDLRIIWMTFAVILFGEKRREVSLR